MKTALILLIFLMLAGSQSIVGQRSDSLTSAYKEASSTLLLAKGQYSNPRQGGQAESNDCCC